MHGNPDAPVPNSVVPVGPAGSGLSRRTVLRDGIAFGATTMLALSGGIARGAEGGASFRILFFTDVHAHENDGVPDLLRVRMERIRQERVDLVLGGGDFIHRGHLSTPRLAEKRFQIFRDAAAGLDFFPMIGNHDLAGLRPDEGNPAEDPRRLFLECFARETTYATFDRQGIRFIMLDAVLPVEGEEVYRGGIAPAQRAWLEDLLARTPHEQPIVLATHIPFRSVFPQIANGPFTAVKPNLLVGEADDILRLFESHNLRCLLQGHLHFDEVARINGLPFVMGGAVSGAWWKGVNHGTPPGYAIIDLLDAGKGSVRAEYFPFGPA